MFTSILNLFSNGSRAPGPSNQNNSSSLSASSSSPTTPVASSTSVSHPATIPPPVSSKPTKRERKNAASATSIMHRKRIKTTIIDDRDAITLLKNLGVTRTFLNSGNILAWNLPTSDPIYSRIQVYLENGQEHAFGMKITGILKVLLPNEEDEEVPVNGNLKMMLWMGTKKSLVLDIMKNGHLQLPVAKESNYYGHFGRGINLHDRASKSSMVSDYGLLFLCEVFLGKMYKNLEPYGRNYPYYQGLKKAPVVENVDGTTVVYDSLMGKGKIIPDPDGDFMDAENGCFWPMGRSLVWENNDPCLDFNEYMIYNSSQVRPRYLVKVDYTPPEFRGADEGQK